MTARDPPWRPELPHNHLPLLSVTRYKAREPWLRFMLQAVEEASRWTTGKIAAIRTLAEHTSEHVRARLPRIYTRELVDVIFELGRDDNGFPPYG